jgi:hypothetical protein
MSMFSLAAQGYRYYDDEFLSPEEIAIREQEKARKASELQAAQEAAQGNIFYAPEGAREGYIGYKTPEQLAAKIAEQEAKQNQAKEQVIAEQGDVYASTVGTGGSFAERQEERAEKEEIYFNEQRSGMASQGSLDAQAFTASPDRIVDDSLKHTNYFAEDNQAKGDPRFYDEIKEDFVSGETSGPQDINIYIGEQEGYKDLIYGFDYGEAYSELSAAEQRLARTDGTIDYSRPTDFQNAKDSADSYYVQSLERSLENATTDEEKESIQKLINNGAPDFDTLEDIQNYDDLWSYRRGLLRDGNLEQAGFDLKLEEYKALSLQEAVMGDYMIAEERGEIGDKAYRFFKEPDDLPSWAGFKPFKEGDAYLNTGTAFNRIPASGLTKEDGTVGQVGGFSYIKPEMRKLPSGIRNIGYVLDVMSIFNPAVAPVMQGMKVLSQTDDVEEAFKAGGKTYVKNKVNDVTKEYILDTYEALDIPVRELDQYTQSKVVDVTNDVLAGKSGTESATDAVQSIVWKNIKEEVGYTFEEFESKFDLNLPDFGLDIDLPDLNLPDVPDFDLPDFDLDIDVPDFDVDLPNIDLPDIDLPDVDIPDINLPDIDLPDVDLNLPDMPDLNVDLDLPDVDLDLSGVEIPEFDFDLDLEGLDTEGLDIEMPEMPDIDLPDVDLPSFDLNKQEEEEEEESEVEKLFLPELFRHATQVNYTQGMLAPKINLRKF